MRFLILAAVLALAGSPLQAQTPSQAAQCRSIQQAAERLACYEKAAPPAAAQNAPATPAAQRGTTQLPDPVGGEQDALKSRLRDICQRC